MKTLSVQGRDTRGGCQRKEVGMHQRYSDRSPQGLVVDQIGVGKRDVQLFKSDSWGLASAAR